MKHVNFIGQFENVSKWIPRSCSVYPDPIPEEDLPKETPKVTVDSADETKRLEKPSSNKKTEKTATDDHVSNLQKPVALFGDKSSAGL